MNKRLTSIFVFFVLTIYTAPLTVFAQNTGEQSSESVLQDDEVYAVKAAVEQFLQALGNGELEKVKAMFLPNANIASITAKDGEVRIYTTSAAEYISQREGKESRKFQEPVQEYVVNISQGLLAFVRADATVYYDGMASHRTNDFFTLMKDHGTWKILSGSYTTLPLDKDH